MRNAARKFKIVEYTGTDTPFHLFEAISKESLHNPSIWVRKGRFKTRDSAEVYIRKETGPKKAIATHYYNDRGEHYVSYRV